MVVARRELQARRLVVLLPGQLLLRELRDHQIQYSLIIFLRDLGAVSPALTDEHAMQHHFTKPMRSKNDDINKIIY